MDKYDDRYLFNGIWKCQHEEVYKVIRLFSSGFVIDLRWDEMSLGYNHTNQSSMSHQYSIMSHYYDFLKEKKEIV